MIDKAIVENAIAPLDAGFGSDGSRWNWAQLEETQLSLDLSSLHGLAASV